ncbi:MAG: copper chaperone PCu(A)C [Burkholderiaceae bacterium]
MFKRFRDLSASFTAARRLVLALCALALGGVAMPAAAHDFHAGDLFIDHPYSTPSMPGMVNGAVYFHGIENRGQQPDRLIAAATDAAGQVELHEMTMEGDIMRMRELQAIELPAGQTVQMRHGQRYHLMLMGLKKPLAAGDRFDLKLRFERAGETTVEVIVQKSRSGGGSHHHH